MLCLPSILYDGSIQDESARMDWRTAQLWWGSNRKWRSTQHLVEAVQFCDKFYILGLLFSLHVINFVFLSFLLIYWGVLLYIWGKNFVLTDNYQNYSSIYIAYRTQASVVEMEIRISVGVVLSIVVMESVSFLQPVWVWHSTLRVSPYVPCRNISSLCFSFPTACMSSQRWQRVLSAIDSTTSTIHPLFQ